MPITYLDRAGAEVLARNECLRLLAGASIGRIGLSSRALPVILPVNFALLDDAIVVRTTNGTKLDAAIRNAVVAFEVDEFDPVYHAGWSVLVTGMAREVIDDDELERCRALPLRPWAPGRKDHFVSIPIELVSGRRISHDQGLAEPPTTG